MQTTQKDPIQIVGIELKTSNDVALQTIPPQWQKFYQEGVLEKIPNKISQDVYGVYTHFRHIGKYQECAYSLIIGAAVSKVGKLPAGLVAAIIPPSNRQIFAVVGGPMKVGEKWLEIWQQPLKRAFVADYEKYQPSGAIDIFIGIK